ncbi:MAG: bifunctional adenosylcobinamide kinase/adenosylcobinamide-phosphate guanylyltransferase [Defluviitaleaceae bacterium]|nr:bifunctional adenosylcobinamide kinase/adenosylcobinamide-phosphate guanylyltransferase [Defluviitaleaceae bacterium]
MITIIGGVYQGKLEYVLGRFNMTEADVYRCTDDNASMPQGKICYEIDKWILALVRQGLDVDEAITKFKTANPDAIVICNDIFCGVVPIDPIMRAWREAVGRAMVKLNLQAQEVVRVFCGIPTKLK